MHLPSSPKLEHWEIIDTKSISPVPSFYDEANIRIHSIAPSDVSQSFTFDLPSPRQFSFRRLSFTSSDSEDDDEDATPAIHALISARNQLLSSSQFKKMGANAFFSEEWSVTTLRKGLRTRIQVTYTARPARAISLTSSKNPPLPPPPFVHLLSDSM